MVHHMYYMYYMYHMYYICIICTIYALYVLYVSETRATEVYEITTHCNWFTNTLKNKSIYVTACFFTFHFCPYFAKLLYMQACPLAENITMSYEGQQFPALTL